MGTCKELSKHLEYKVPKNIWTAWASKAKAFANTYNGRSFAEVLKKGIPKISKIKQVVPVAKVQQRVSKTPTPTRLARVFNNHPTSSNSCLQHVPSVVSNTQNSDFGLNISSKFQILASNDIVDNISQASDNSLSDSFSMNKMLVGKHLTTDRKSTPMSGIDNRSYRTFAHGNNPQDTHVVHTSPQPRYKALNIQGVGSSPLVKNPD